MSKKKCLDQLRSMKELLDREMTNVTSKETLKLDANPINVFYAMGILECRVQEALRQLQKPGGSGVYVSEGVPFRKF